MQKIHKHFKELKCICLNLRNQTKTNKITRGIKLYFSKNHETWYSTPVCKSWIFEQNFCNSHKYNFAVVSTRILTLKSVHGYKGRMKLEI